MCAAQLRVTSGRPAQRAIEPPSLADCADGTALSIASQHQSLYRPKQHFRSNLRPNSGIGAEYLSSNLSVTRSPSLLKRHPEVKKFSPPRPVKRARLPLHYLPYITSLRLRKNAGTSRSFCSKLFTMAWRMVSSEATPAA